MSLSNDEVFDIAKVAAQEYHEKAIKPYMVMAIVRRTMATEEQARLMVEAIDAYVDQEYDV